MSSVNTRPVRVRIAPSPTGDPHVGTAYIALFNMMFARQHGGQFLLRIEDTDQERSSRASETAIFEALKWLGLHYDEGPDIGGPVGPYRQSERLPLYKKRCEELVSSGKAYRCFCTKERLDELKELQRKMKSGSGYDGHCRYMDPAEVSRRLAAGEPHVVRLRVEKSGKTGYVDGLRGLIEFDNAEVDDQVLLKSDGFPTYHLANVVDDQAMGITHVIRAEEWIPSTPKHLMLYAAFGWEPPQFFHMPLLRNADKSKISKRKNPVSLTWYRESGYLPEALVNFLALQGWSHPSGQDKFTRQEMLESFDITRVGLSGPVFDLEKLGWLNGMYIRELPLPKLRELLKPHIPEGAHFSDAQLTAILPLVQERLRRLDEFHALTSFFHPGPVPVDPESLRVRKKNQPDGVESKTPSEAAKAIESLIEKCRSFKEFEPAPLETAARDVLAGLEGWKPPEFFMLLRKASTGTTDAPPLFDTLSIIGKETCLNRWEQACRLLRGLQAAAS
ncbi:MAG: glutamate--tRNA ligase [Planctomycetota bacterium]